MDQNATAHSMLNPKLNRMVLLGKLTLATILGHLRTLYLSDFPEHVVMAKATAMTSRTKVAS